MKMLVSIVLEKRNIRIASFDECLVFLYPKQNHISSMFHDSLVYKVTQ